MHRSAQFYNFRKRDNKSYYYAGIILDAFCSLKCSKQFWHNWQRPNDNNVTQAMWLLSLNFRSYLIYYTLLLGIPPWKWVLLT